ncbi:MAG: hypothetical protein LBR89_00380 [Holosporales bacterium]|nr:hypothetical protein [Holosporales bacterium]
MSLNTNLNASLKDMLPYVYGLLDRIDQFRKPYDFPTIYNEDCLYLNCPIIFGNAAVQLLPSSVKANLDLFLHDKLPNHEVGLLASDIFYAMLKKDQSWFGIDRYMHERNVKHNYKREYRNSILILRNHVQLCMSEWFKRVLSLFAPQVVQCIREGRLLSPDTAKNIALTSYKTNHCCVLQNDRNDDASVWVHEIYAKAEAGDDDILEKCKNCIEQINTLKSSISEQTQGHLQVFFTDPEFKNFKLHSSYFAPEVVQCIREGRRLPPKKAMEIATALYKIDHCYVLQENRDDDIDVWVHKIYADAEAEASDDDIREKCKDCIAQINALKSLYAAKYSKSLHVFLPRDIHVGSVYGREMPHEACEVVWKAFLLEECPQLSQQEWPNVPSTWRPGWQAEWCDEFELALCSLMPGVAPDDIHSAVQLSWGDTSLDVLPTTLPPDLTYAHQQKRDRHLCIYIPESAINQAWLHAWKHIGDKYLQMTPELLTPELCSEGALP